MIPNATIHSLISDQARIDPQAIAVWQPHAVCTYRDLEAKACILAEKLLEKGVGKNTLVGLCMPPSLESVIVILAILKTGGAVAAVGDEVPDEKLRDLVRRFEIGFLIVQDRFDVTGIDDCSTIFNINDLFQEPGKVNFEDFSLEIDDSFPALVLFTSGTTGNPKAVLYDHAAFIERINLHTNEMPIAADDVYAALSPVSSIDFWDEVLVALTRGACTALIPDHIVVQPDLLAKALERSSTTRLLLVPSLLKALLKSESNLQVILQKLRLVAVGGEALSFELRDEFASQFPQVEFYNYYGLTEGDGIFFDVSQPMSGDPATVPIGLPQHNTWVDIIGEDGLPVKKGSPGEIFMASKGLAKAYYKDDHLSAESFQNIPAGHPCSRDPARWGNVRLKTGDLARELPDGNIEYLGRMDRQVKIRGNTIHLNEIEKAAGDHPLVNEKAAVMKAIRGEGSARQLVLYYVGRDDLTPAELRTFLTGWLPEFAIPAAILAVDHIPRNANGKVDEKALPTPHLDDFVGERDYIPPESDLEKKLASIWEDLLHVNPVGITDDFFELGGDSMQIIVLLSIVEEKFGRNIPLSVFFQAATISRMAFFLQSDEEIKGSALVPIQAGGDRPPLFVVHADGGVFLYKTLADHLGEDQPVYGLQALDPESEQHLPDLRDMAAHYIQAIKTVQPEGPYNLGAFSLGGIILFEIGYQLHLMGEDVGLLAFLDASGPAYPKFSSRLNKMRYKVSTHTATLKLLTWRKKMRYLYNRARSRFQREMTDLILKVNQVLRLRETSVVRNIRLRKTIHTAVDDYQPKFFPGKLVVYLAKEQPVGCVPDQDFGWGGLAKEIEIIEVEGSHNTLIKEPYIQDLAAMVRDRMII